MRRLLRALAGVLVATGVALALGACFQGIREGQAAPQVLLGGALAALLVAGGAGLWRSEQRTFVSERRRRHAARVREVAAGERWLSVEETARRAALSEDEAGEAWSELVRQGAADADCDAEGRLVYRLQRAPVARVL